MNNEAGAGKRTHGSSSDTIDLGMGQKPELDSPENPPLN